MLREVDACCVIEAPDAERHASWQAMNAFAAELVRLQVTVFTLNYDSLLMSALLEHGMAYDGFRFGTLNVPLDRWSAGDAVPPARVGCLASRRCRAGVQAAARRGPRPGPA